MNTTRAIAVVEEKQANQLTVLNRRSALSRVGALVASTALPVISGGGLLMIHGNAQALFTTSPEGSYVFNTTTSTEFKPFKNRYHVRGLVYRQTTNPRLTGENTQRTVWCYEYYSIYQGISVEGKKVYEEFELKGKAERAYGNVVVYKGDSTDAYSTILNLDSGDECRSTRRKLAGTTGFKTLMVGLLPAVGLYTNLKYAASEVYLNMAHEYETAVFTLPQASATGAGFLAAGTYMFVFVRDLSAAGGYSRTSPLKVSDKEVKKLREALAAFDAAIITMKGLAGGVAVSGAATVAALGATIGNYTEANIAIIAGLAAGVATKEYYKGLAELAVARQAVTITCQAASTMFGLEDVIDCNV